MAPATNEGVWVTRVVHHEAGAGEEESRLIALVTEPPA
jgi:hypothetical protein